VSVGRLLTETLIGDLPERPGAVRAVVAADNVRSLRLCERIGLREERRDTDRRFVQRLGRLT
jgi:RimJ/RimL family protein N-acetyltransferase